MGAKLLNDLAQATGLPEQMVTDELTLLINKAGKTEAELTLEDLRLILAEYVQDVLLAAKDEYSDMDPETPEIA